MLSFLCYEKQEIGYAKRKKKSRKKNACLAWISLHDAWLPAMSRLLPLFSLLPTSNYLQKDKNTSNVFHIPYMPYTVYSAPISNSSFFAISASSWVSKNVQNSFTKPFVHCGFEFFFLYIQLHYDRNWLTKYCWKLATEQNTVNNASSL